MANARVTDYLLELSDALADVPREVRVEIVAGVREELEGLSDDEARVRIRELGDPAFIAAAAREEAPAAVPPSNALAKVAAIGVMIGGLIVPFAGWIVGIVLMWMSPAFTTRTKLLVTVLPTATTALIWLVTALIDVMSTQGDDRNPLVPAAYDAIHSGIITLPIIAFATGIYLLLKLRKRA